MWRKRLGLLVSLPPAAEKAGVVLTTVLIKFQAKEG